MNESSFFFKTGTKRRCLLKMSKLFPVPIRTNRTCVLKWNNACTKLYSNCDPHKKSHLNENIQPETSEKQIRKHTLTHIQTG